MALSNTTELASIREERLARPQRRRNSIPDCDDGMLGLLATTERLRMEGVSVEAQQAERLRLDESRDQDLVVMEQDALLRMRQSVSSVFNAPDIPGDDTYSWLWESAEDTYEYWTATDVTPVTSVQMPEVRRALIPNPTLLNSAFRWTCLTLTATLSGWLLFVLSLPRMRCENLS